MTPQKIKPEIEQNKIIISYAWDLPNICSLAGLLCTVIAIYFIVLGLFPAAMIGMI